MKFHCVFLLLMLTAFSLKAQIIHIPSDQPTIQAGIEAASEGDTILVEEDTYYENINFLGKAITVASRFILDGDTSHISRTIIDGSQSTKVDTGSVVFMMSLEDTTSVLTGFTITGGTGSHLRAYWKPDVSVSDFLGGGVAIVNAGGKIVHNIIEHNCLDATGRDDLAVGGGVYANVSNNRTAIIRNNIIRNNMVVADNRGATGAGACFVGGRFLVEANQFNENTAIRQGGGSARGGGFYWGGYGTPGVIREVIFRNNIISQNKCLGEGESTSGGGAIICFENGDNPVEFYNNIVAYNYSDQNGGGLLITQSDMNIINNTIYGNLAASEAHNIGIEDSRCRIINNIIWSDPEDGTGNDIEITGSSSLEVHFNLLRKPLDPGAGAEVSDNIFAEPLLDTSSYDLFQVSPGIGYGMDTLVIGSNIYLAPATDLHGNSRPHPVDNRVDLGAVESPYEGFVYIPDTAFLYALIDEGVDTNGDSLINYSEAEAITELGVSEKGISDLTGIGAFVNLDTLRAHFNSLTAIDLSALTKLTDFRCWGNPLTDLNVSNNTALVRLVVPLSNLSELDISNNPDLEHLNAHTNSITDLDVSNNPELINLWIYENEITYLDLSNNENLETLWLSDNKLNTLDISNNRALTEIEIENMPSLSEVCVWTTPFPPAGVQVIKAGSPNVDFRDCVAPELNISQDSWYQPEHIEATSSEDGWIYLVPEGTGQDLPDIIEACIGDSVNASAEVSAEVPVPDTLQNGVYWLYARDETGNISDAVEFNIMGVGIDDNLSDRIRIYPNPTYKFLSIGMEGFGLYDIRITSLNGQLIFSKVMEGTTIRIDLSDFSRGIYFITIRSEEFVATRKIIKL